MCKSVYKWVGMGRSEQKAGVRALKETARKSLHDREAFGHVEKLQKKMCVTRM